MWSWLAGRVDYPAASSCALQQLAGDPSMPPAPDLEEAQVVLLCRSHFAVTAIEAADPPIE
jgi:hypothetical protein